MMDFDEVAPPEQEKHPRQPNPGAKMRRLIDPEIDDSFYALRKARNEAVHKGYGAFDAAVILLEMAWQMGVCVYAGLRRLGLPARRQ